MIIQRKLKIDYDMFWKLRHYDKKRLQTPSKKMYDEFRVKLDKLFDVFEDDSKRRDGIQIKRGVAPMIDNDFEYLKSQRTDRKMICERKIDIKWAKAVESDAKRKQKYHSNQTMLNSSVSSEIICLSDTECEDECNDNDVDYTLEDVPKHKRAMYSPSYENDINDPLPLPYRHIRQTG